jgi:hypothetical protein
MAGSLVAWTGAAEQSTKSKPANLSMMKTYRGTQVRAKALNRLRAALNVVGGPCA